MPRSEKRVKDAPDPGISSYQAQASHLSAAIASGSRWAGPSAAHPQVFLFDEPLDNLDAKLRVQIRVDLKKRHYLWIPRASTSPTTRSRHDPG